MENVEEILSLCSRKKLSLTMVESVDFFSDKELKLTVLKRRILINGSNIKIVSYNEQSGNFSASGDFTKISYEGEKISFMKKIFK